MSYMSSIIKSTSGVLKGSDAEKISGEYAKKSKMKKVHFSDVIEICFETVSCSQMLVDGGSELSDIFEVPLNKRNIKKIQILQTADYLNMEDFQEKYNEGMALQYCHKKLHSRNSAQDFIGSKDFTAPLATMEEVDMFCDDSPDSSFDGFENVYFLSVEEKHQSQVISGFDDSKDHLINEVVKNIICESAVKEDVVISKTLNHCDDCDLYNADYQNLSTCDEMLLAHKADALNSNRITLKYPMVSVTATQNEHATAGMFALVENISDSLVVEVPIKSAIETTSGILSTNAFPAPVEVPRFLTSSVRSALIKDELQGNDENTIFECVVSDADFAVMSAMHETNLSTPLPVASKALRSGEFVTRPESKEIEHFVDNPCISNQLESDKKTELLEDYMILDEIAIESDGIQDDFVTADEVPDFNEFVLIDQTNIYNTIHNKLFNTDALEKLQTTQVTEESVSIDKAMMDSGFGSEETELPLDQCLEQDVFMTSPVSSQASVSRASPVKTQHQTEDEFAEVKKASVAKFQTSVMNVGKVSDSCCELRGSMADSIDNPCTNLNSGIFQENFDRASIRCNSELPLAIDCCSYPALGSRDSESTSEYAFKTQMIESSSLPIGKQFRCIFVPNLVWLFKCNYQQWDVDSTHFEGSSIMCKEFTKCTGNKALNKHSGGCYLKMCKTKKSSVLQKHHR